MLFFLVLVLILRQEESVLLKYVTTGKYENTPKLPTQDVVPHSLNQTPEQDSKAV